MPENKIKYNLKNVHVAKKTGKGTYEPPFPLPGAVSLSLDAAGDINKFYADGIVYHQTSANNGYDGTLEIAMITDQYRTEILNETVDSNDVMFEDANTTPEPHALLFQIDGDKNETLFCFYNCSVTRPSTEAATKEESVEPQTDSLSVSCAPDEEGIVRAKTGSTTTEEIKANWFKSVYQRNNLA